jgi:iron complex outermembrane receptor protein
MKELSRTKRKLLYALLSSSFLWQLPADSYTSETPSVLAIAASPEAEDSDREFDLPGVEVTAVKDRHDQGYMAKRSQIGTKTDTALHETARSISVISREQMEARGVTDLFDALSYTPGFSDATYNRDSRFLEAVSGDSATITPPIPMGCACYGANLRSLIMIPIASNALKCCAASAKRRYQRQL